MRDSTSETSVHSPLMRPHAQVDYYTYVSSSLLDLDSIPRPQRLGKAYREYLQGVVGYLEGFYQRTQPLAQLDKQYAKVGPAVLRGVGGRGGGEGCLRGSAAGVSAGRPGGR